MPRTPRENKEVEKTRDEILDQALAIIGKEGYANLSMRKLGDALGCAAKTIYNYYTGKEEIYIRVLTCGFEKMNALAELALEGIADPLEQMRALIATYIRFGTENANYYNIMFNWNVPKYMDYVGTVLEPIARVEKEVAFHFIEISKKPLTILAKGTPITEEDLTFIIIRLWSALHGLVSLINSGSLREFEMDQNECISCITESLLKECTECTTTMNERGNL